MIKIECIVAISKFFLRHKYRKNLMSFINLKVCHKKNYSLFVPTVKYNVRCAYSAMHSAKRVPLLANVLGEKYKKAFEKYNERQVMDCG